MPEVRWINGTKIHRGYQDQSGLFTLEQDQKDSAGEVKIIERDAAFEAPVGAEFCKNCYPPADDED